MSRVAVLDFTSSLYLGLRHASSDLRPWDQFTTGKPVALAPLAGADIVDDRLARLIGCKRATLGPSTLHLFWDLFGLLSDERIAIYVDAGTYPIARWGVERALARGALVRGFKHLDVSALQHALRRDANSTRTPIVVTDGFCPDCGRHAPLSAYLEAVRVYGGHLIVDDTQALGIFGHSAEASVPYGKDGGGSLRWWNIDGEDIILIASLAKGFGVPVAVLAGSRAVINRFEEHSETRVHCSPPSIASIRVAEHALNVNDDHGTALRFRLVQNVRHFRTRLSELGLTTVGGWFPVQSLQLKPDRVTIEVHDQLRGCGIETVLHSGRDGSLPRLSFIITARHYRSGIDQAVDALHRIIEQLPQNLGWEETYASAYRL